MLSILQWQSYTIVVSPLSPRLFAEKSRILDPLCRFGQAGLAISPYLISAELLALTKAKKLLLYTHLHPGCYGLQTSHAAFTEAPM